mmetsp:Transcript_14852/g.29299  ORF Transcript_14852/g.29299 Transcript_14852/m.29299 type:complete len:466 (+) Transcript_14852:97-1494(+)
MGAPPQLAQAPLLRMVQAVRGGSVVHHRAVVAPKEPICNLDGAMCVPSTPSRAGAAGSVPLLCPPNTVAPPAAPGAEPAGGSSGPVVPNTPRRSGSGTLSYGSMPSQPGRISPREQPPLGGWSGARSGNARERLHSADAMRCVRQPTDGAQAADGSAFSGPHNVMGCSAVPPQIGAGAMSGRGSLGAGGKSVPVAVSPPKDVAPVNRSSLLAGSSLGQLIARMAASVQEEEQRIRRHQQEHSEVEELLARSGEELQQLISVVSQLHELQQSADVLQLGPERPRPSAKPPFSWQPSSEYAEEFQVSGENGEVVTKLKDFEDQGWVIPVGGSWRLMKGGLYRWTMKIERKCPSRPQLQLGVHGMNHSQPWRLVTTSRCSWSRDDEPWQDRPGGDRLIDEGNYVHVEVDLRGIHCQFGIFALAINDEPYEIVFTDIPLDGKHGCDKYPLIPVVSMGGAESRVRLCPSY